MVETSEIVVYIVSGVAAILAVIVCILILILCHIVYARRKKRKHQIGNGLPSNQGTALTTLTNTVSATNSKHLISAFASGRDASSIVKSDTSTTSSNHIRVSDGSDSSTNSTKADGVIVATTTATEPPTKPAEVKNPQLNYEDTVSADYAEIEEEEEEDKSKQKQIGGTLQSTADSTLSTVSSFNSSTMRDSTMRDSTLRDSSLRFSTMTDSTMGDGTLLYVGGQNSYLDNLEPGAHNTPRFPIASVATGSQYDHLALNKDYEKDPSYIPDHDYEQDPDYQKQKRDFNPPLPPAHLYQALQQQAAARNDIHYRAPERNLRPISEKLPHSLEQQPDYADAIPHYNSLSSRQAHNYDYAKLRASTLDPLPHYTHLDIKTKENVRGSGLSYVTTDL